MLEAVKLALRLTSTAFDDEITALIEACKKDLMVAGVGSIIETDPLIKSAIKLYAKAYFGYVEDGETYKKSYDSLKNTLCLAGDYSNVQRGRVRDLPKKTP